jgi:hypothetical protein
VLSYASSSSHRCDRESPSSAGFTAITGHESFIDSVLETYGAFPPLYAPRIDGCIDNPFYRTGKSYDCTLWAMRGDCRDDNVFDRCKLSCLCKPIQPIKESITKAPPPIPPRVVPSPPPPTPSPPTAGQGVRCKQTPATITSGFFWKAPGAARIMTLSGKDIDCERLCAGDSECFTFHFRRTSSDLQYSCTTYRLNATDYPMTMTRDLRYVENEPLSDFGLLANLLHHTHLHHSYAP